MDFEPGDDQGAILEAVSALLEQHAGAERAIALNRRDATSAINAPTARSSRCEAGKPSLRARMASRIRKTTHVSTGMAMAIHHQRRYLGIQAHTLKRLSPALRSTQLVGTSATRSPAMWAFTVSSRAMSKARSTD